jgi:hypothetical protein
MRVFVNNQEVEIMPGMTVRHALIGAGFQKILPKSVRVMDEWENTIGMEGALDEGAKILVVNGTEAFRPKGKSR